MGHNGVLAIDLSYHSTPWKCTVFPRCGNRSWRRYNHTREPNPELLEECTTLHRLITLASDQSENLSFLNKLGVVQPGIPAVPNLKLSQPPMWPGAGGKPHVYDPGTAYVAVIISDGDNIAEDW